MKHYPYHKLHRALFFIVFVITSSIKVHAQDLRLVVPIGHTGLINSAQFSPDGRLIVTASQDNTAKIWDAETGQELLTLEGHSRPVNSAQFSPDGKTIVTGSNDNTAKIWDAETGQELHSLEGHSSWPSSPQFSPDGKSVVTASSDNTAKIWDAETGQELRSLVGHSGEVESAHFSPDGKTVVTASSDNTAKIWDVSSGQELHSLEGHSKSINSAQFSPDGKTIVTASEDSTAKIWDAHTGQEIHSLVGHSASVEFVQFSPDSKTIVTTSDDATLKIWNTGSGQALHTLEGYSDKLLAQFSPDGKTIVTSSSYGIPHRIWKVETGLAILSMGEYPDDVTSVQFSPTGKTILTVELGLAKIWSATTAQEIRSLDGHSNWVSSAEFSPDGKTIVTASIDNTAQIWNAETGQELHTLEGEGPGGFLNHFSPNGKTIVNSAAGVTKIWNAETGKETSSWQDLWNGAYWLKSAQFSPNGKTIVAASFDGTARIWNAETGQIIHTLERHDKVNSAQFSPDGRFIVTVSRDGTAKIWDAETGQELRSLVGHSGEVESAQFSPDGKTVVTASWDNTAKIWDAETGQELHSLEGHSGPVNSAHFSPEGKAVVTTSDGTAAKIWNAETGLETHSLEGHSRRLISAQFSPDGKKIVTASDDNTSKIWDVETGQELHSLEGHSGRVNSAQFSPDGKTIVTGSSDNTTKIWDTKTGKLLYTRLMLVDGGWLAWDPEYRFDGSHDAIDLLHFACGSEVIELSQAKGALYVPNLIALIMRGEDLSSERTLESLDLCGRTPIVTPLPGDGRGWQFDVEPRKGGLQYCEVYIDGVRRFDIPVAELERQANGHYLLSVSNEQVADYAAASETEIAVIAHTVNNLTSRGGNNWVSVSAPKGNQGEAERAFYGLFIGINDYKGKDLRLNYAAADARELGQVIEAAAAGMFGQENTHVTTLLSDYNRGDVVNPPEKHRVLAELERIAERSNAHDILFVHLAGHGTVNENGEFVFLTSEASSLEDGQYTGVTMQEMSDALMGIKASNRVFIFDACHSGEAMQDALEESNMAIAFTPRNTVSTEEDIARGKQLERLGDKANMTMLSASASDQAAFELPEIGHGLLTYALLNAIQAHSDILDDGRFLEVKPWIFQAERTVNSRSQGPNRQQAQSHTPHNYPIGEITPDVRGLIQIDAKPVISNISLRNELIKTDNLQLGEKIENHLNAAATRGGLTLFIRDSPNGINIEGKYSLLNDGRLRVRCEFFTASQFLGEAEWIERPEADWHRLISEWILENQSY